MNARNTRTFRRLAWMSIAAALATPAAAPAGDGGGSNGMSSPSRANAIQQNDIAHFGDPSSTSEQSNPILRNDQAHYATRAVPDGYKSYDQRINPTLGRPEEGQIGRDRMDQRSSTVNPAMGQRQSPAPVVVRVDGGFDWVSAGVGAAGGFGLLLVAAVGTSALRRWHPIDEAQA